MFDNILIEELEVKNKLGIILSDKSSKIVIKGIVASTGPGKIKTEFHIKPDGTVRLLKSYCPMEVHENDIVVFDKNYYREIEDDNKKYYLGSEDNILAVEKVVDNK